VKGDRTQSDEEDTEYLRIRLETGLDGEPKDEIVIARSADEPASAIIDETDMAWSMCHVKQVPSHLVLPGM